MLEKSICAHQHAMPMVGYAWITRQSNRKRAGHANPPYGLRPTLLAREISQIRWRLALPGRHQQAIATQHVVLIADAHELLAFGADVLDPGRPRILVAAIALEHRPGPRQPVIDHREVVVQEIGIGLVE